VQEHESCCIDLYITLFINCNIPLLARTHTDTRTRKQTHRLQSLQQQNTVAVGCHTSAVTRRADSCSNKDTQYLLRLWVNNRQTTENWRTRRLCPNRTK